MPKVQVPPLRLSALRSAEAAYEYLLGDDGRKPRRSGQEVARLVFAAHLGRDVAEVISSLYPILHRTLGPRGMAKVALPKRHEAARLMLGGTAAGDELGVYRELEPILRVAKSAFEVIENRLALINSATSLLKALDAAGFSTAFSSDERKHELIGWRSLRRLAVAFALFEAEKGKLPKLTDIELACILFLIGDERLEKTRSSDDEALRRANAIRTLRGDAEPILEALRRMGSVRRTESRSTKPKQRSSKKA